MLIVCCDGLTGFPEAIEATWPHTIVQTCVVHLIRASMRFVSYTDRKAVAAALRPIYTAPTEAAAAQELDLVAASNWGKKYPATVRVWRDAWERFIPFLEFPPAVRKIIYTTNSIESLNYQLRKIIKNRGHFPNDDAVIKLLWLAIRDIEDKRARERAKEAGLAKGIRAKPHPSWSKAPSCRAGTPPTARSASPSPAGSRWPYDPPGPSDSGIPPSRPIPPARSRGQPAHPVTPPTRLDRGEHRHIIYGGGTRPDNRYNNTVYTEILTTSSGVVRGRPRPSRGTLMSARTSASIAPSLRWPPVTTIANGRPLPSTA